MAQIREGEIMKEGTQRFMARDAQRMNILAGRLVAETVRTTLGPRGMDKMLVDSMGDVVITNDGHVILKEMDIAHPAAKMVVEVSKTQEDEVGDGTTTAAVLTGEFLAKAEELLDQKIHSSVITRGYSMASEQARKILHEIAVDKNDDETIRKVVMTTLTGKGAEAGKKYLADLALKAVRSVAPDGEIDRDDIKLEKKQGGSLEDSRLIKGVTIDKEVEHNAMPRSAENAKIALLDVKMEIEKTETSAEIRISSPEQMQAFMDQEEKLLREMADKVAATGATVLFTQKGMDDLVAHYLAKKKILAAKNLKKSDMDLLAKATGAKVVSNVNELKAGDLGFAGSVKEEKFGKDKLIIVEDCKNPKAVTVLLRGGTKDVVEDLERAMHDAVSVAAITVETGKIVAGGGATEVEVSRRLKEFADTVKGREQLAVRAFAESLEVIPRTLADNAGLDPIDILVKLREKHSKEGATFGLDVFKGTVIDMMKEGVVEPLKLKEQAIKSASEAAIMILRIDDVIAATKLEKPEMPEGMPPGGMGGMGGMPPM